VVEDIEISFKVNICFVNYVKITQPTTSISEHHIPWNGLIFKKYKVN
jgi:hypothetical protein